MKRPPAGAYDPYITIASPGGKPVTKPRFRVLMSKSMWKQWENAVSQAGDQNVQQLWNHLAYRPDQLPLLGSVTRLKGGHMKGKEGWSDVHHYEITGAGRINYQFHPDYAGGAQGDKHAVVKVTSIDMSSH